METPQHTVREVSDYFLKKIDPEKGDSITPLKLQKLVYYAQAWHYTVFSVPLFKDKIQAWTHGPAVKSLYGRFYHYYRNEPIIVNHQKLADTVFDKNSKQLLDEVYELYGEHSGSYLEQLTHSEDPWINARKGCKPYEASTNEITLESMKAFYSKKFGK